MAICMDCTFFYKIPSDAGDYEPGKGDCVTEHKDEKGKFWLSRPVFESDDVCGKFSKN
jgi:benzylsuccinate synthase/naphthyl-2-methylsuccinate synthase gamma subunit